MASHFTKAARQGRRKESSQEVSHSARQALEVVRAARLGRGRKIRFSQRMEREIAEMVERFRAQDPDLTVAEFERVGMEYFLDALRLENNGA